MKKADNPFEKVSLQAENLVLKMTIEEKASLCSGKNFWSTKAVERLGVKEMMVTDGPHGLRKQSGASDHLGINNSVPSTCFPPAAATACSFDTNLLYKMGEAMAEECIAEEVGIILGPAANIKRSPLCGRNFEYFSEDPLLAGEMSAALINGIQSKNVGTSMKHYLANNQEKARVSSNSVVDERALREIYMAAFELAIKKAQPWTLMCSYNKINDIYASDNKRLMTDIPRSEWGFSGAITTDWGAMNDRVKAIEAGLDLEMPGPCNGNDEKIIKAVKDGTLKEEQLNKCAVRMTAIALLAAQNTINLYDKNAHNELARQVARESAVLLRLGKALPIAENANLAIIGDFAKNPRYQGAGSSKINPHSITSLCDALDGRNTKYTYAQGFNAEGETDQALIAQAVNAANNAQAAVVMLGLPDSYESEGFDRTHLNLPENQTVLMNELIKTGVPIVAVLSTGAAVLLPWNEKVDSILLMYLAGQNSGNAIADLIFGKYSPCGKLAETWPSALEDTPCHGFFGGSGNIEYRESIYVGYRYYDKAEKPVAYPFGYGLSYTSFEYSNLTLSKSEISQNDTLTVSVTIKNTGDFNGSEIVQLYVAAPANGVFRPVHELRSFDKVYLQKGESKTVTLVLNNRAFAYYDVKTASWKVDSGTYIIQAAASCKDIRLESFVLINGEKPDNSLHNTAYAYFNPAEKWPVPKKQFEALLGRPVPLERPLRPFTSNSTLGELEHSFMGRIFVKQVKKNVFKTLGGESSNSDIALMLAAMLSDMPLRQFAMLSGGALNDKVLSGLVEMLNGHYIRGLKKMK